MRGLHEVSSQIQYRYHKSNAKALLTIGESNAMIIDLAEREAKSDGLNEFLLAGCYAFGRGFSWLS